MADTKKQRVTAFIDPVLVRRAKVRAALEGLTISEVIERALDVYAPKIDKNGDQYINLKFADGPDLDGLVAKAKHTKTHVVPR